MNNTYYVYICKDCGYEVHQKYFYVPALRDVHRTIRLTVDADTETVMREEKAKNWEMPELRDDLRMFYHKKYRTGDTVDNSVAVHNWVATLNEEGN